MDEQQATTCWDQQIQQVSREEESSSCRIISPYPYPHASQEEIEEREHLSDCSLSCFMHSSIGLKQSDDGLSALMDCDDFTISSKEIHSLSGDDICLHSISDDPTLFWQEAVGIQRETPSQQRDSGIPTEIRIVRSADKRASPGLSSSSSVCSCMSDLTI